MERVAFANVKIRSTTAVSSNPVQLAHAPFTHAPRTAYAVEPQPRDAFWPVDLMLEFLVATTGASGAAVAIMGDIGLRCCASAGEAPAKGSAVALENTLAGECILSGQIVACADAARVRPDIPTRSILLVPVVLHGYVRGVLGIFWPAAHAFTDSTVTIARAATATLVAALDHFFAAAALAYPSSSVRRETRQVAEPPQPSVSPAPALEPQLGPRKRFYGLPCHNCHSYYFSDEANCAACGAPRREKPSSAPNPVTLQPIF